MPLYEYQCQHCSKTTSFLLKKPAPGFWERLRLKCGHCKSKKIKRIISSFSVSATQSRADMLNDLSKMGPINFVPQYPGMGGPPGGVCPYASQEKPKEDLNNAKNRNNNKK